MSEPETLGMVLGTEDATPLEFWFAVRPGAKVQLDDLVVVEVPDPALAGPPVSFFGVVDRVRRRLEGIHFEGDTELVVDGLPTCRCTVRGPRSGYQGGPRRVPFRRVRVTRSWPRKERRSTRPSTSTAWIRRSPPACCATGSPATSISIFWTEPRAPTQTSPASQAWPPKRATRYSCCSASSTPVSAAPNGRSSATKQGPRRSCST